LNKVTGLILRILKITGITILSALILLFLAPYFFPDIVGKQIKNWTNQSISGDLNFSKARLSFFTHFPSLTLTLYNVDLKGSAPFQKDTLLYADKLGFGVNLEKLILGHQVSVNKIFLTGAYMHVLVDEKGQANYNIYTSDTSFKSEHTDTASASLLLEKIIVKDSYLEYNDRSIPMLIQAEHFYYEGSGDLSKSIFDLASHIRIDSLNIITKNHSYVRRKAIDANLVTHVNTKTLAFSFENDNITVNKLNIAFSGKVDFLKNGYDINTNLAAKNAELYQLITILPPEYLDWLSKTTVKGKVDISASLKGKYIVSANEKPDLSVKLAIRDGFVSYQNAEMPIGGLNLSTELALPSLDPEKLQFKVDEFRFSMEKESFHLKMESHGFTEPRINMNADAVMNLQNLKKSLGLSGFDMKGEINIHLLCKGRFARRIIQTSFRNKDTVIASVPIFTLQCSLKNGYVKYNQLSQPLQNIFVNMKAECPDSNYKHAFFKIDSLYATAMNDFIQGKAIVHASADFPMDVSVKGLVNLADVQKIYPLDSLSLSGLLQFDIQNTGKYAPDHHIFPKTNARFSLKDGFIQTKYYPHPIEKINIEVNTVDKNSDLKSLEFSVDPASMDFEGKPFYLKGRFKNFEDLNYDISLNGEIDLGRIYRVFAIQHMGLTGFIRAQADFKGKQSDAESKRFDLLKNSGTIDVKDIRIYYEMYPKPFLVNQGHFRFDQNKMWFETFKAQYGKSDIQLDGFAENVINFVLGKNEILKANFDLKAKNIDLNEFEVYSGNVPSSPGNQASEGVIMIPANLDLAVKATADQVIYNDITMHNFESGVNLRNSEIELDETGFKLIGCQVSMKGKYSSISTSRAKFEYHLVAKEFDVQKAYQQIKLFHDLASSAQHASGIISFDYSLSGKLNENMYPIYPSLTGGGVLSVKNLKFNGWKLFNTVSKESGKTELTDPDLSKIDIKSTIKNNLITIERTKFKTGGMRIRFEGQTSFDNKVNFKMRIGLPPLGIIGIPVHITGNAENPQIKMSKSDDDPLQEKEE
jgi:AsmA protein